jgi:glycosyltransferase involved in cell wall biosynthesis
MKKYNRKDFEKIIKSTNKLNNTLNNTTINKPIEKSTKKTVNKPTKSTKPIEKKGISIVISAYEAENFIEECLDSVEKQTYFENYENYEILLGIDGCKKTLEKVKTIKNKYRNLKVYWFEENSGPYLVFNTMIKLYSNYEIITIFGADDIMLKNHIEENLKLLNNKKNVIKSKCSNFNHPNKNKIIKIYNPDGLIFLYKDFFFKINGFDNWRCGADSDILSRLFKYKMKIIINNRNTVMRRIHSKNLTKINNGSYRNKIIKLFRERKKTNIFKLEKFYIYEKDIIEI